MAINGNPTVLQTQIDGAAIPTRRSAQTLDMPIVYSTDFVAGAPPCFDIDTSVECRRSLFPERRRQRRSNGQGPEQIAAARGKHHQGQRRDQPPLTQYSAPRRRAVQLRFFQPIHSAKDVPSTRPYSSSAVVRVGYPSPRAYAHR